jgi:hypothetical protein
MFYVDLEQSQHTPIKKTHGLARDNSNTRVVFPLDFQVEIKIVIDWLNQINYHV